MATYWKGESGDVDRNRPYYEQCESPYTSIQRTHGQYAGVWDKSRLADQRGKDDIQSWKWEVGENVPHSCRKSLLQQVIGWHGKLSVPPSCRYVHRRTVAQGKPPVAGVESQARGKSIRSTQGMGRRDRKQQSPSRCHTGSCHLYAPPTIWQGKPCVIRSHSWNRGTD